MNPRTISSDIVIVGAGPAGIAAAAASHAAGKKPVIIDDNPAAGGQIWRSHSFANIVKHSAISKHVSVHRNWTPEIHTGISISDAPQLNLLIAETSEGPVQIQYERLIIATGARERLLPFPGWTLPNVMGAGGLQALVKSGLSVQGKRIVVAGTGPLLLAVAAALRAAGGKIIAIVEQAPSSAINAFAWKLIRWPSKIVHGIGLRRSLSGIPYWKSSWVVEARGNGMLESVRIRHNGILKELECDFLACGYHLVPNAELPMLLGCTMNEYGVAVNEVQETSMAKIFAAGEVTGIGGVELSVVEGLIAGYAASGMTEEASGLFTTRAKYQSFSHELEQTFKLRDELRQLPAEDTLVCRCEDVPYSAVKVHTEWRAAKLQTRCGMGLCQGRVCGPAVSYLFGWDRPGMRPPIVPVSVGSLSEFAPHKIHKEEIPIE